jgi:predicted nucleic-acid-binding protein
MIGLDTNVLVRFFAQDTSAEGQLAHAVLAELAPDQPGFITLVALTELAWVLTRCYHATRREVQRVVETLLGWPALLVEAHDIVQRAVRRFANVSADFADCLIERAGNEFGCRVTLIFDRVAARDRGFFLLAAK